jgi:hypothetical protein
MWCKSGSSKGKICPFSFGIAFGVAEGLFMLVLAWAGWLCGSGMAMIDHISSFMDGYGPSLMGGLVGGGWGLLYGFIFGFVVGIIYDLCVCCCCKKSSASEEKK